ncbi:unnamed protein product [Albugo candida]|uniref:Uncharacterized protein n=1 Tax=Albugo candida TaxID=65357 RepID=A0A024GA25_9STRA|nr:unnamed protein product [Albugo candida]|eukprot:CCI43726.1 unnamed protein product [Albugo candida]
MQTTTRASSSRSSSSSLTGAFEMPDASTDTTALDDKVQALSSARSSLCQAQHDAADAFFSHNSHLISQHQRIDLHELLVLQALDVLKSFLHITKRKSIANSFLSVVVESTRPVGRPGFSLVFEHHCIVVENQTH